MNLKGRIEKLEAALGTAPAPGPAAMCDADLIDRVAGIEERIKRGAASEAELQWSARLHALAERFRSRLAAKG
jgi:hypothetical protein